jgi:hypothetical protein
MRWAIPPLPNMPSWRDAVKAKGQLYLYLYQVLLLRTVTSTYHSHQSVRLTTVSCAELSTTPWRRTGEWKYGSMHSLTSALDDEWSASWPGRFTPRERAPATHWLGGWVGPRAGLNTVVRRKIPSRRRDTNPDHLIVQPVGSRYTDWFIPALISLYVCNGLWWKFVLAVYSKRCQRKLFSYWTKTSQLHLRLKSYFINFIKKWIIIHEIKYRSP